MKKLIAILVVFAIMVPALFAQDAGEWSINGKAQIGTRVDLTPWEYRTPENENSDQTVPLVGMTSYQDYQQVEAQFGITYRRGSVTTGLTFRQSSQNIRGSLDFNNGTASFSADSDIYGLLGGFGGIWSGMSNGVIMNVANQILPANLSGTEIFVGWGVNGTGTYESSGGWYAYVTGPTSSTLRYRRATDGVSLGDWTNGRAFNKLEGGYKFLDGIIDVRVALRSSGAYPGLFWNNGQFIADTYTNVDGSNFLAVNVSPISGLGVGFILPGIFDAGWTGGTNRTHTGQDSMTDMSGVKGPSTTGWGGLTVWDGNAGYRRFIQDSVERMTFGIGYGTGPFSAAVQYGLRGRPQFYDDANSRNIRDVSFLNSVLFLGAQLNLSAITINLDVRGEFFKSYDLERNADGTPVNNDLEDVSRTALAMGARFQYEDGPMRARLGVLYFNDIWTAGWAGDTSLGGGGSLTTTPNSGRAVEGGVLRLHPYFRYSIIPTHLMFRMEAKLDLPLTEWALNRFDSYELDAKNEWLDNTDSLTGPGTIRSYTLGYEFVPEFFFNFMGTGATDGIDMDANFTGIGARYRLAGLMYTGNLPNKRTNNPTRHAVDVIFRWSF